MSKHAKILAAILGRQADANIRFGDLTYLLGRLGFAVRIRGDHHIFTRSGVEEIINLQPQGAVAKPYQIRQVRDIILRYRLGVDDHE